MVVAIPISFLVLWELCSRVAILSPRYFPPPTLVAATLASLLAGGDLWGETLVTLNRLAVSFVLAAVPGVPAGLAMGLSRPVRNVLEPYIALLYPLPKIALLPLFLILLGVGERAFILTGAITAFFQIVLSTLGGVQSMDPRLLEVGRNYGARGVGLFRKIVLPAVLPSIFTGLRLGLGLALIAVIAVEFVTAKSGLGHLVFRYWQMLLTAEMFAAFVLVGLIGLALTRGLRLVQRRALAWEEEVGWL